MTSENRITKRDGRDIMDYWVCTVPGHPIYNQNWQIIGYVPPTMEQRHIDNSVPYSYSKTLTRSGSVTPQFNSPNRPRLLPENGYTMTTAEHGQYGFMSRNSAPDVPGDSPIFESSYQYGELPGVNYGGHLTTSEMQALERAAQARLLEKLKNMKINVAQALAERHETARTVIDAATKIANSISFLRKGNISAAAGALGIVNPKRAARRFRKSYVRTQAESIANGWLALQYGWKPLLNDVYGACEALAQHELNPVYFGKESAVCKRKSTNQVLTNLLPSNYKGVYSSLISGDDEYIVKYGCTYTVSSSSLSSFKGLGITNPLLLAWELLPFSFVADWFLPVGKWMSSLDATAGLTFVSGYKTTLRRYSGNGLLLAGYVQNNGTRVNGAKRSNDSYVQMTRSALTSFPGAPLPRFQNPLSLSHAASSVALLIQSFKK